MKQLHMHIHETQTNYSTITVSRHKSNCSLYKLITNYELYATNLHSIVTTKQRCTDYEH